MKLLLALNINWYERYTNSFIAIMLIIIGCKLIEDEKLFFFYFLPAQFNKIKITAKP